jgi:hypothetical protein
MAHNTNARLRDEFHKDCQTQTETLELRANTSFQQTSDMEMENMRIQLRFAELKTETLEMIVHMMCESIENEIVYSECQRENFTRRLNEMEERGNLLHAVLADYLSDDSSNESEPEGGGDGDDDPAEEEGVAGRELTESRRKP